MLKIDAPARACTVPRGRLPGQPLRLIVVEDDVPAAEALSAVVTDLGHTVCGVARNAAEAAELVGRERPDLALMDVRLGGDGIAAARRLNLDHGIRSIYLSGNSDHGTLARITETYPLGVVHKPFSHAQLKVVLDLAARRLR
ncbi:response regulator [Azospirillum sp. TSO35-2]|uniref:response regulator n=1 Tax=Azospirillum sp. TSO35-2 TaxID=716796 RepID=UPI000D6227ED|nr:response regulator [Azospirillum sp. TSO35-2]PWC32388.1 regulator [Azospirillum sp. TSO35-2]